MIFSNNDHEGHSSGHDSPDELALDDGSEMSFPASDPIALSNITRVEVAPEMSSAAADHQNSAQLKTRPSTQAAPQSAKVNDLKEIKVAILVTDGFEQAELVEPRRALEAAGAKVEVISDKSDSVQGYEHTEKGVSVIVDKSLDEARSEDYAAVLLPGGVVNGDAIRMMPKAQKFVQRTNQAGKPIAAICHGGWLLISAGIAADRTVTSWPSLQDDFKNAGSHWVDKEVVCDNNLVSSRKPDDIPAFNKAFISLLNKQSSVALR